MCHLRQGRILVGKGTLYNILYKLTHRFLTFLTWWRGGGGTWTAHNSEPSAFVNVWTKATDFLKFPFQFQEVKHNIMNSSQESDHLDSMIAKNSASEISFESQDTDRSDVQNTLTLNNDDSGISNVLSMSPRNSSEFDDLDTQKVATADKAICTDLSLLDISASLEPKSCSPNDKPVADVVVENSSTELVEKSSPKLSQEFDRFLSTYKQELEQLKSQHREHYQDLKERFNDRVDDLLKKLSEANSR